MRYLTLLLLTLGIISSCTKDFSDNFTEDDALLFGVSYGECFGEHCKRLFKLTDKALFEGDLSAQSVTFHQLDDDIFQEVKELEDFFPSELLTVEESQIGCPDCNDFGAFHIYRFHDGDSRYWTFDRSTRDNPEYLRDFIEKIDEKIAFILGQ